MKTLVATGGERALRWWPRSSAGRRPAAAACCCWFPFPFPLPLLLGPVTFPAAPLSPPPGVEATPPPAPPPPAATASLLPLALLAKPRSGDGAAAAGERAWRLPVSTFPFPPLPKGFAFWFSIA